MIEFETIKWKNLLATGNNYQEVQLNNNSKMTLIMGKSGSGKSTLLDAICFVLFGKPFRKFNKPDLVNTINEKNCVVAIDFKVNKKKYKIIRGIKPAVFEIYENDKIINQDSKAKDYQKLLEQTILKMNFKSFTQIVILGSSSFVPFMQLPAQNRRSIIEELLDIQVFGQMNELIKRDVILLKENIRQNQNDLDLINNTIEITEKHNKDRMEDIGNIIEKKKKDIEKAKRSIKKSKAERKILKEGMDKLYPIIKMEVQLKNKIDEGIKAVDNYRREIIKFKQEQKFFNDNDNCFRCKQPIDEQIKKTEIFYIDEKIQNLNQKIENAEVKLGKLREKEEEMQRLVREYSKLSCEFDILEPAINYGKKNIIRTLEEIETFKKKAEENNQQKDIEEYKDKQKNKMEVHKNFIEARRITNIVHTMLNDEGIKTRIIKKYLPIMNKLINKYLSQLDLPVGFHLDEKFSEHIKSRFRDSFKYWHFSEGEKQRIDIALLFAWREVARLKNSTNCNLLILDEIFDSSLDVDATEALMKLLQEMSQNTNVTVISHKGDVLVDKFDVVLRVKKIQQFTSITVEK